MTQTFCERVVASAGAHQDKVAMVAPGVEGREQITFGEMLAQIRSLAYRLTQEGIGLGDRVALLGENHPHWALAYFGILYRGAVAVPLDPAATVDALAHFIEDSEAKLAFVGSSSLDKFRGVCERLGRQVSVVALQPTPQGNGYTDFANWARTPFPPEFAAAAPPAKAEDIAVLMYTSGTTGMPKAVPLTHGNIYAESDGLLEAMRVTDKEVILSLLPPFHAYSQTVNLWLASILGAQVHYVTELSSAAVEHALKESRATALLGVPRLWYLFHKKIFDEVKKQAAPVRWLFAAMMRLNGWLRDGLMINAGHLFFRRVHESFGGRLWLAVLGGASFDANVALDFHRLGFTILQGYGLTETAAAATATRFEDNVIGSVGTPLNGVEVKIDEPNAEGIGEVLIRGPIVMPGYYHNPEANREAFTPDGWFRSGDLGRFDSRGHLFIVGRKKDVIKLPSGKNVFPEDVEAFYEHSPLVSEVCVLGVRDESSAFARAEKLLAVVVPNFDQLKDRRLTNASEWVTWELDNLGRELPEYQRVRDYIIRSEPLPRTTTRKVKRFEVKQWLESSGASARQLRDLRRFVLRDADRAQLDSPEGKLVVSVLRQQKPDAEMIHPQMNLELDLGLDSLARAECAVSIEQAGVEITPEDTAITLTVGDLIEMVAAKRRESGGATVVPAVATDWHKILSDAPDDLPDIQPVLKRKPVFAWFAYTVLRVIRWMARIFCRMEVEGLDVLKTLRPPFVICPNHQSFLDPLLVSSVYPIGLLRDIFHVGFADYFGGPLMNRLAREINLIPVDADVHLLRAMRAGAAGLRAGKILNIYPEGQRSLGGQLAEFRKGAAILATELNVPIVPVALDGLYRVWPRGSWLIRPAKVKICFGAPIYPSEVVLVRKGKEELYEALTELMKQRIQQMLDEMRAAR
ncbi:MAG: AMP-binding protein [Acidobacteria bacterium]|nr:AMP-binding protein [Acidobacteriota bacterium]